MLTLIFTTITIACDIGMLALLGACIGLQLE